MPRVVGQGVVLVAGLLSAAQAHAQPAPAPAPAPALAPAAEMSPPPPPPATTAPSATPAPTEANAAVPAAPASATPPCPQCPPGFLCQPEGCLPDPLCPPGYRFDGYYCIPAQTEEEHAYAARLANRNRPKFTLGLEGGVGFIAPKQWPSDATVGAPTGLLLFGYRRNYEPHFGAVFRGGLMLAIPILDVTETTYSSSTRRASDSTFMTGVMLEAVPYLGPFGRFYVGPAVFLGYVAFLDNDLRAGATPTTFHLSDGWLGGAGVAGGVLVGGAERIDVNFSFRLDMNPTHHMTLFLTAGVGFLNF